MIFQSIRKQLKYKKGKYINYTKYEEIVYM